ncbi:MAG TPA: ATP-binding protein [Chthoniobacteraceae bacterium]|nr:ATP-binding protein [Chthoniobacteraceae bacterium]
MKRTLEFASHPGNLSLMRNFAREFLGQHHFTETEIDIMVLGLDEAATNVIRYAYEHDQSRPITLTCEQQAGCVVFRMRDLGKQCDPAKLCARPIDQTQPGGLGLHLIRKAFDGVNYVLKDAGTELVLTKNLPAGK